jgi:hypothetical protein
MNILTGREGSCWFLVFGFWEKLSSDGCSYPIVWPDLNGQTERKQLQAIDMPTTKNQAPHMKAN